MPQPEIPLDGGSLLLAWQLKDKRVLIVGGGEVASTRIRSILTTDALITVIAPSTGLHPDTKFYIENCSRITYIDNVFSGKDDLQGMDLVLTAIDDNEWSQRICTMCRVLKIPVNVADVPNLCDFYFGSQIRRGRKKQLVNCQLGFSPSSAPAFLPKCRDPNTTEQRKCQDNPIRVF